MSALRPMQFGEVHSRHLPELVKTGKWFQQKLDGQRVFVRVDHQDVAVFDVNGDPKANPIPKEVLAEFSKIATGVWYFDGELVDRVLWLFDVAEVEGVMDRSEPYSVRLAALEGIYATWDPQPTVWSGGGWVPAVQVVPTARTAAEKSKLLKLVRDGGGEGIMVKDPESPYEPGVESSGMVRAKFKHTADVIVHRLHIDEKDNCAVAVIGESGEFVEVGRVKLHGQDIKPGDMIEVEYLYVVRTRLVQPQFKRKRKIDDKVFKRCSVRQLHYTDKHTIHAVPT